MNLRYANDAEIESWNTIVNQNPGGGNILQGKEFLEQKADSGWVPTYLINDICAIGVLERTIPLLGKIWYCPKGPSVESTKELETILEELIVFAKHNGVFSIKIEPELDHTTKLTLNSLIKTRPVQPHSTVLIDLSPPLEEILSRFNQKGRHALRRAERDGVTVKTVEANEENCDAMYALLKTTAEAAHFMIRPKQYYVNFYQRYESAGLGKLFFAYVEGEIVAGAFAITQGAKSIYKDGASVRERPVYGASHLLQWHVIQWAKDQGSLSHDLVGVPPIDQIKNPAHPFYGLGRFKTSFNKSVTEYVGAYDVIVRPTKAKLWHRYIEKLVRRIYARRHRQSFY